MKSMIINGRESKLRFNRIMEGLCIFSIILIVSLSIWKYYSNSGKPFPVAKFPGLDACVAEKVRNKIAGDQLVTNGMVDKFLIICNDLENSKSQIEKDKEAAVLQKKAIGQLKQH